MGNTKKFGGQSENPGNFRKLAVFSNFLQKMTELYILWMEWRKNLVSGLLDAQYMTFILNYQSHAPKIKTWLFLANFWKKMAEFYIFWMSWTKNLVSGLLDAQYTTFIQNY